MEKERYDNSKITRNLSQIKHKIIVLSGKGGVGKSTISVNLALTLSGKKYKIGLLDSDLHGPSIPKMLGIEEGRPEATDTGFNPVALSPYLKVMSIGFLLQDRDSPIIWRGPLKMGAIKQFIGDCNWGELDYLIIDLPPGTGDEPLSIAQLIPNCDGTVIVTTPQDVAILDARKSVVFAKEVNVPVIGIIENMSGFTCPHCGVQLDLFSRGGGQKASEELGVPFLGSIPFELEMVRFGDEGKPYIHFKHDSETAKLMDGIVDRIKKSVGEK